VHQFRQGHGRVPELRDGVAAQGPPGLPSTHAQQVPQVQSTKVRRANQEMAPAPARLRPEPRPAGQHEVNLSWIFFSSDFCFTIFGRSRLKFSSLILDL